MYRLACFLALTSIPAAGTAAQQFDLLLRNGHVLDGSGSPAVRADVAIAGSRIVAVGRLPAATDLVVFDLATIQDHATIMEPDRYSDGIAYVLVNGRFTVDGGRPTGTLPGVVLRRGR